MSKKFYLAVCCAALLATAAWAAELVYEGNSTQLQTTPTLDTAYNNSLFPGTTSSPLASGNTVEVRYTPDTNATGKDPVRVFGGLSTTVNVSGNTVTLTNGKVTDSIHGGSNYASSGGKDAVGNKIFINGGEITGNAVGGRSQNGKSTGNTSEITGGKVGGLFVGGQGAAGASGNKINIKGGTIATAEAGVITGAAGAASDNHVTVSGGKVDAFALGGVALAAGNVTGNTVTILGNADVKQATAGEGKGGTVSGNILTISGGKVGIAASGYNTTGPVTGNKIFVSGGNITEEMTGNYSTTGDITGNEVTITGGTITANPASNNAVTVGMSVGVNSDGAGDVSNNKLSIGGRAVINGIVRVGSSQGTNSGETSGNELFITGGTITGNVEANFNNSGKMSGNTVTISNGKITGDILTADSYSESDLSGNTLVISGGEITADRIYAAGFNQKPYSPNDAAGTGKLSSNTVLITGGTIKADSVAGSDAAKKSGSETALSGSSVTIIGGTLDVDTIAGGVTKSGSADAGNSVTIGEAAFTTPPTVYGGLEDTTAAAGSNTLKVVAPVTVKTLAGFKNVEVFVSEVPTDGKAIITTTDATDLDDVAVKVTGFDSASGAAANSNIKLFSNVTNAPAKVSTPDGELSLASGAIKLAKTPKYYQTVKSIDNMPAVTPGKDVTLPNKAGGKNITSWTVLDAGATGAVINGYTLTTTAAGTLKLQAIVEDGSAPGVPSAPEVTVTVAKPGDGGGSSGCDAAGVGAVGLVLALAALRKKK